MHWDRQNASLPRPCHAEGNKQQHTSPSPSLKLSSLIYFPKQSKERETDIFQCLIRRSIAQKSWASNNMLWQHVGNCQRKDAGKGKLVERKKAMREAGYEGTLQGPGEFCAKSSLPPEHLQHHTAVWGTPTVWYIWQSIKKAAAAKKAGSNKNQVCDVSNR